MNPPNLSDEALCAQVDGDVWFPVLGHDTTQAAKAVCNGTGDRPPCPVREACLAWALDADERYGVWGGLSPNERKKLARGQKPRAQRDREPITHGTEAGSKAHYRRGEKPCRPCLEAARIAHRARRQDGAA